MGRVPPGEDILAQGSVLCSLEDPPSRSHKTRSQPQPLLGPFWDLQTGKMPRHVMQDLGCPQHISPVWFKYTEQGIAKPFMPKSATHRYTRVKYGSPEMLNRGRHTVPKMMGWRQFSCHFRPKSALYLPNSAHPSQLNWTKPPEERKAAEHVTEKWGLFSDILAIINQIS